MANDISADVEGDFIIEGGGLKIATDKDRDRNLILTRIMTLKGELTNQPSLGVPARFIGGKVTTNSKAGLERAIKEALLIDTALVAIRPTVRAMILGYDRIAVFIQSNKSYSDSVTGEKMVISADYYTMSNMPTTKLDGTEG